MKRDQYTAVLLTVILLCLIWLCLEYRQARKDAAVGIRAMSDALGNAEHLKPIADAFTKLTADKPQPALPDKNRAGFAARPFDVI
jgi:hypothetical protein